LAVLKHDTYKTTKNSATYLRGWSTPVSVGEQFVCCGVP
jgi:hypothetical protein